MTFAILMIKQIHTNRFEWIGRNTIGLSFSPSCNPASWPMYLKQIEKTHKNEFNDFVTSVKLIFSGKHGIVSKFGDKSRCKPYWSTSVLMRQISKFIAPSVWLYWGWILNILDLNWNSSGSRLRRDLSYFFKWRITWWN